MKILSSLILMIIAFFKKLKIQELLTENTKKTEKLFFYPQTKIFGKAFTGQGGLAQ